jgi:hypothetical protein
MIRQGSTSAQWFIDVSSSGYVASLGRVMDWKGCGRREPWPNVRHSLAVFLKRLRKITRVIIK